MIARGKKIASALLFPIASLALFLLIWQIGASVYNVELVLPSPSAAFRALLELMGQGAFWQAVFGTLGRTLFAFALSFVLALGLAVAATFAHPLHRLLYPIVAILRAVPTMSVILLALIWFRPSKSPLFIAFLVIFPMLYLSFYESLCGVDKALTEMSVVYRVSAGRRVLCLYLPAVLRTVFTEAVSALTLGVKVTIAAEALAQTTASIGLMMQLSKYYLETAELLAWTMAAVLISALLEGLVRLIRRAVRFPL